MFVKMAMSDYPRTYKPWIGNSTITLNCVEPRKGPCVKLFTKVNLT